LPVNRLEPGTAGITRRDIALIIHAGLRLLLEHPEGVVRCRAIVEIE
jgi:hypothetical protein